MTYVLCYHTPSFVDCDVCDSCDSCDTCMECEVASLLSIVLMVSSTCVSGIRRTQGWAGSSSGRKSRRPQGMLGQVGQRRVEAMTTLRSGVPQGPKMRGSVGPNRRMVGVFCATARCSGPLSTPSTSVARCSNAAIWPMVISVSSKGGGVMPCAICSSIDRSAWLPVRMIRAGEGVVTIAGKALAQADHASVRQSLTAAPVPGWITTMGSVVAMPACARRSCTHACSVWGGCEH